MSERSLSEIPAIGLTISHAVAENRSIVSQCFVPFDCPKGELDAALDKVFEASERQVARIRLPQARADLARLEKAYQRASEDMERLDAEMDAQRANWAKEAAASGRRDPRKGAAQVQSEQRNKADRDNTLTSLKRGRQDMDNLHGEIEELERKTATEA